MPDPLDIANLSLAEACELDRQSGRAPRLATLPAAVAEEIPPRDGERFEWYFANYTDDQKVIVVRDKIVLVNYREVWRVEHVADAIKELEKVPVE